MTKPRVTRELRELSQSARVWELADLESRLHRMGYELYKNPRSRNRNREPVYRLISADMLDSGLQSAAVFTSARVEAPR